MSELEPLNVTFIASTRALTEAMFKLQQRFVATLPAIRRYRLAQRLATKRIHPNARRRPKRKRR